MPSSNGCDGRRNRTASTTCAACATITSANRASEAQATVSIERRGRAIRRVNIQNAKGKAKAYQVRQVLAAIERLEEDEPSQE